MRKNSITTEEFIRRALLLPQHKNEKGEHKYTYEKVDYKKSNKKVIVTCKIHGDWEIVAGKHICENGQGCKKCAIAITKEEFLRKAQTKFGDRYCLDNIEYKGWQKRFYEISNRVYKMWKITSQ